MHRFYLAVCFSVLASLFLVSINNASAQVLPDFALPSGAGESGESVPLNLDFLNDGDVGAINFTVEFDQNVVDFQCNFLFDVVPGPDLNIPSVSLSSIVTSGQIIVSLSQGPAPVNPLPDGEILTIRFCINSSASAGESTDLQITVNSMTDTNGAMIEPPLADVTDGLMNVVSEPPQNIDVNISKLADTNRIDPGIPVLIAYTINLQAIGDPGAQATEVLVTDDLPLGSTFRADLSSEQCGLILGPNNTVLCEVGALSAGEDVNLTIVISITGIDGENIGNQAILDFINEIGNPVQKQSNVVTVRVRGGGNGGGGGCALSSASTINTQSVFFDMMVLLAPALLIFFRHKRKK